MSSQPEQTTTQQQQQHDQQQQQLQDAGDNQPVTQTQSINANGTTITNNANKHTSRKHVELRLTLKRALIREHEAGVPFAVLGRKYRVATSTASNIYRRRECFKLTRMVATRKRCNDRSKYKHVNLVTSMLVRNALDRGLKIDGECIKQFGIAVAQFKRQCGFAASNGWLDSLKKRENVCWVARKLEELFRHQQKLALEDGSGDLTLATINDAHDPTRPRLVEAVQLAFALIKRFNDNDLFKIAQPFDSSDIDIVQQFDESSLLVNAAFETIDLFDKQAFTDFNYFSDKFYSSIPLLCNYIDSFDEISFKNQSVEREAEIEILLAKQQSAEQHLNSGANFNANTDLTSTSQTVEIYSISPQQYYLNQNEQQQQQQIFSNQLMDGSYNRINISNNQQHAFISNAFETQQSNNFHQPQFASYYHPNELTYQQQVEYYLRNSQHLQRNSQQLQQQQLHMPQYDQQSQLQYCTNQQYQHPTLTTAATQCMYQQQSNLIDYETQLSEQDLYLETGFDISNLLDKDDDEIKNLGINYNQGYIDNQEFENEYMDL